MRINKTPPNLKSEVAEISFSKGELGDYIVKQEAIEALLPFKIFKGNNPTNTLMIDALTPESLGKLVSMYEHKIFVQGVVWNIFSYDQWGVELGKQLASVILTDITKETKNSHDNSTQNLLDHLGA